MRISDWSSDVCSSDLARGGGDADPPQPCGALGRDRVMEAAFDAVAAGAQEIRLTVNGKPVALVVDPRERLSEALRHERSEEHTSELQSLMRISYAFFCLKKKHILDENHDTTLK